MEIKTIYFNPIQQKVRYVSDTTSRSDLSYHYIGKSTRVEFDLLVELLWYKYQDLDIPLSEFKKIFEELKNFCDSVKYQLSL
mgnify:FL=1|tara:strand:- start:33 stop:278 length:246 start_codon:yes stop_codon:yes gene_type:complete